MVEDKLIYSLGFIWGILLVTAFWLSYYFLTKSKVKQPLPTQSQDEFISGNVDNAKDNLL